MTEKIDSLSQIYFRSFFHQQLFFFCASETVPGEVSSYRRFVCSSAVNSSPQSPLKALHSPRGCKLVTNVGFEVAREPLYFQILWVVAFVCTLFCFFATVWLRVTRSKSRSGWFGQFFLCKICGLLLDCWEETKKQHGYKNVVEQSVLPNCVG